MCLSLFYAQVIGVYAFLIGLAFLTHPHRYKKVATEFLGYPPLIAISGAICLAAGIIIVNTHNVWVSQWPVLITLAGWYLIFHAVMRLFFTDGFVKWMKEWIEKPSYTGASWAWLLIGLYLIWVGFSSGAAGS